VVVLAESLEEYANVVLRRPSNVLYGVIASAAPGK
jgi:hypothetical protein